jgi:hypothetical protein
VLLVLWCVYNIGGGFVGFGGISNGGAASVVSVVSGRRWRSDDVGCAVYDG